MQYRKKIRVEDNMSYVTRMTQNKNDLINAVLQYGDVVDKNCCVVFPVLGFPY